MKAWILEKPETLKFVTQQPSEMTEARNAKVKVEKVLYSRDDWRVFKGAAKTKGNIVIGSLGVGVVSETLDQSQSRFSRMERVIIEPFLKCNDCFFCKQDKPLLCVNKLNLGFNTDGLLSDFICLPQNCLFSIPDNVSSTNALLTPLVSQALNIIDKIELEKGDHVAVLGGGKLGVILSCLINYYQAVPIFADSDASIVNTALRKNVFYAFKADSSLAKSIFSATGGRMCEKVVYFAESTLPVSEIHEISGINGIVCVSDTFAKRTEINLSFIQNKNLTLKGVDNCYGNFPSALNLLAKGIVKADDFLCQELSFNDLDKVLPTIDEEQTVFQNIIINNV